MRRAIAIAVAVLAIVPAVPARAQAQDDIARADVLFNAAKALTDSGRYADACAKFAESKRIAPGVGVTMYLADCYEHIGRTASAWTEFRAAEGLARDRNDKRADIARQHAQALEPKLERLTIRIAPTVPQAGLSILRDGVPVPSEELGLAVPVDPGDHAVVVSSPGHVTRTFATHLGPDSPTSTVLIDSLEASNPSPVPSTAPAPVPDHTPSGAAPPAVTPQPAPPASDEGDPGRTRRYLAFGAIGFGVVGLGLGTAFAVVAKSTLNQSNAGPCDATDHCSPTGLSDRKSAETQATVSTVGFVVGGVLAAGGIALYLTAPKGSTTGVVVAPAPMTGGGGALVQGTF